MKETKIIPFTILKKEKIEQYALPARITSPDDLLLFLQEQFGAMDREYFIVVCLDIKNEPTEVQLIAVGTLNEIELHPREVFKGAILSNAAAIIMAHNHPSGDTTPSETDIKTTEKMCRAGELLGIPVLDHVIFGDSGYHCIVKVEKM